jgi:hypothetical protein
VFGLDERDSLLTEGTDVVFKLIENRRSADLYTREATKKSVQSSIFYIKRDNLGQSDRDGETPDEDVR